MNFEKHHRQEPTEPQLATMIDVFSILIIFLIAGTAMDSSVLNIPVDITLPSTQSKATSLNAPQVTLQSGRLVMNFIQEEIELKEMLSETKTEKFILVKTKLDQYLEKVKKNSHKNKADLQLLQSINLVADRETPYVDVYSTIKAFRNLGFQNTILVGMEQVGKK